MQAIIDAGNYDDYRIHFGLSLSQDCIKSRPVLANIVTKSELATTNVFAFLISALSNAAKMVPSIRSFNSPYLSASPTCATFFG